MKQEEFFHWIESLSKVNNVLVDSQNKAILELKKYGFPNTKLKEWRFTNSNRFKKIFTLPIGNDNKSLTIKINSKEDFKD